MNPCQNHAAQQERDEQQHTPEPFGYFKAEPFGWVDCAETDEGAVALYDKAAIDRLTAQRDELLAALEMVMAMDVKGHQFQDRLQFSTPGREILNACRAAIARVKGESK